MNFKRWREYFCKYFFRDGVLYLLVFGIALIFVDVPGVIQSVKIRRLNDMAAGIEMSQLYAFSKGEIPSSAVDWKKLYAYFSTTLRFFPSQEDSEMMLGYCEYYGFGEEEKAFEHFRRSAQNMPYLFWNVYNTGLFLFKIGDMDHAILFLEMALLVPADKMLYSLGNSIVYRQFFAEVLNQDLEIRLNRARENVVLLLAAANYYKHDYNMAELFAMKGISESGITDREPFYFYAGAVAMANAKDDEALSFFQRAIKAKSKNPQVYQDAADLLKKSGRLDESHRISQIGQSLGQADRLDQFPYPNDLKLQFY